MIKRNTGTMVYICAFTMILGYSSSNATEAIQADDNQNISTGKALHKESCTKCHTTSVYTREDRTIPDLASLNERVEKCNINTRAGLNAEELKTLTFFLNKSYYKFENQ